MLIAVDTTPPSPAPVAVVIDANWAAPVPPATLPLVDPRIRAAVAAELAAELAAAPAPDPAPNRQAGLQAGAYGRGDVTPFAKTFADAKVGACLSPATGGLGILAIPVIAVQALRGKCRMP